MNRYSYTCAILVAVLFSVPGVSFGQEQSVTAGEKKTHGSTATMPVFPPSDKCSSSSPCHNILGEVLRIEESYWLKLPNGDQMRVKASRESKMDSLPKVGDRVAAQITSTGDVEAIVKLDEMPKPDELPVPQKSFQNLR
jgi:hypothetical protein